MIFRVLLFITLGIIAYFLWRVISLKLKQGASIENASWHMFYAALIADPIFKAAGADEAVITSGSDGEHSARSKHYAENNPSGMVEALDFRTRDVANPARVARELRSALGSDYDVVLESDHIHVEYDPKGTV